MRRFKVVRDQDITGISGTGVVAEGVEFSDGSVVMRWLDIDHNSANYKRGVRPTIVIHESITSVEALHGHNGATHVEFVDEIVDLSQVSDGYHTFAELYHYRMLYNALAANCMHTLGNRVYKSWNHSDGKPCFDGGWFIVVLELPQGQVTNHYKEEWWDLFNIPSVERPSAYDGHTPQVAAARLLQYIEEEQI